MQDALIRKGIVGSPLGSLLGLVAEQVEPDSVRVRLPYRPELTTMGDLVHGGAIAALVDTAATAVAWSGVEDPTGARGTTVDLHLNFLSGARGQDIRADARIVRRGGSIVVCEVDVVAADGTRVAKSLVTYKLDRPRS